MPVPTINEYVFPPEQLPIPPKIPVPAAFALLLQPPPINEQAPEATLKHPPATAA